MTSNWTRVRLADVSTRILGRTPSRKEERYWTSSAEERPFCTIADMKSRAIEECREGVTELAEKEGKAKRVPAGSLLLSFKLSLGRVGITQRDMFTNEAIAWIRPHPGVHRDFLALALESLDWDSLGSRAVKGKTLNSDSLDALEFLLPPIVEQHRIVDLIAATDDAIEAADLVISECDAAWLTTILAELAGVEAEAVSVDSMFGHVIGGSWGSPAGQDENNVLALGPSSYAGSSVFVDPSKGTLRSLSAKRAAVRSLEVGDIILERSGGSPTQPVGRVIKMASLLKNVVPSDFMRLLRPNTEIVDPDFAFLTLWALYRAGASLPFQKFTTGIRNLNIPDYLAGVAVRIPKTFEEQERIVAVWTGFLSAREGLASHAESLRTLRSELLNSLLSQAHNIPESYDEIMVADREAVNA